MHTPTIKAHGGLCCGRRHLNTFPSIYTTGKERDRQIETVKEVVRQQMKLYLSFEKMTRGFCIEVVLKAAQMPLWAEFLFDLGFKEVHAFVNVNSGNTCHMLLWTPERAVRPAWKKPEETAKSCKPVVNPFGQRPATPSSVGPTRDSFGRFVKKS